MVKLSVVDKEKAMTEKVAYRKHPERVSFGGRYLWGRYVKTIPELQCGNSSMR